MIIGDRLSIEFSKYTTKFFYYYKPVCGCRFLEIGPVHFVLFSSNCKCVGCDKRVCECESD